MEQENNTKIYSRIEINATRKSNMHSNHISLLIHLHINQTNIFSLQMSIVSINITA